MNPLLQLEKPLIDLKNMAGLLGHLSTSERDATGQELEHIRLVHPVEDPNPLWHITPPAVCLSSSSGTALPSWH